MAADEYSRAAQAMREGPRINPDAVANNTPGKGNRNDSNRMYLVLTAGCAFLAICAVGIYAASRSELGVALRSVGLASVTALAAFWLIGIIGFLFGVPPASADDQTTNQSLEQITDWLTKIIIGATLVQLGAIGSFIADVGDSIGEASKLAAGPQLYTALIVATAACGFIFFYFWTRMCWETMRRREQLGHAKQADALVAETIRALEQLKNAGHLSDEEHVSRRNSVLDEWLSGKVSSRR